MKVADYVIQYLADLGIKKVFVVYGAACGDLIDAFTRIKGTEYVAVMHEQAGSFAAEVYAKLTGLGACIATSGPGGINLLNGIANCYYDSTPCIFITGQVNSQFLKKDKSIRQLGFQENDIVVMAKPITKWSVLAVENIPDTIEKAVHVAKSGRPGPVLIDIPLDIQKAEITDFKVNSKSLPRIDYIQVQKQIWEFLNDLKKSQRPVILIGGGVRLSGAVEYMRKLGEFLQIPCLPTWNAVDIITNDYKYYRGRVGTYGSRAGNFTLQNSDLILSIGSRISGRITGGAVDAFAPKAKKYIVDIDSDNLQFPTIKCDMAIHADAYKFIDLLYIHAHSIFLPEHTEWLERTKRWLEKYKGDYIYTEKINPYVFIKELSRLCSKDSIVVSDCGGNVVNTYQAFETKFGQRLISSHGNSPMGFSFAGAIGACFASDKPVICIIGDGGFNMNIQELQTVKNYNLPLKTFILNNHSYGITKQYQDTNFESRYEASGPKGYNPPDFMKIVRAYDIETETIQTYDEMERKIRAVLDYPRAIVCDVDTGDFHQYEPRVFGWNNPIDNMYPYLPKEELEANRL